MGTLWQDYAALSSVTSSDDLLARDTSSSPGTVGRATVAILAARLSATVFPSADSGGATDPGRVQDMLAAYGVCYLAPGAYYGDSTVTGHEAQYVRALGPVTWNLTVSGIPAFRWTPANTASYSQTGRGGITGGIEIVGPSGSAAPGDGSIAVQMGDIVFLESDIYATECEYGLLLQNDYFWTEDGRHVVHSHACANPVVLQCATTGGTSRTGSFDRSRIRVYHDETVSGSFGHGVQLLAGAQLQGGEIRQYGNFSGTGQAGVFALYIDGASPAGAAVATQSSIVGAEIVQSVEYDGSGTKPGTVHVGTSCYVKPASGNLNYYNMAGPSLTGTWNFYGPISGDSVLASTGSTGTEIAPTLAGATGYFYFMLTGGPRMIYVEGAVTIAASTTLAFGTVLASGITAPWIPPSGNSQYLGLLLYNGTDTQIFPCAITGTGTLEYIGPSYTTVASSSLQGSIVYRAG